MKYPVAAMPEQHAEPPFMVESRIPVGESRLTTHVIVPAAQALITMLLIAVDVMLWQWRPIAGAVGAIGLGVWGWRILLNDRLLWRRETITGRDINGDGVVGDPHPFVIVNKNKAQSEARAAEKQAYLESRAAELIQFAASCATTGTSEERQGVKSAAQRAKYLERRDALFELGLAVWKNPGVPNSAWYLTATPERTAEIIENYVK